MLFEAQVKLHTMLILDWITRRSAASSLSRWQTWTRVRTVRWINYRKSYSDDWDSPTAKQQRNPCYKLRNDPTEKLQHLTQMGCDGVPQGVLLIQVMWFSTWTSLLYQLDIQHTLMNMVSVMSHLVNEWMSQNAELFCKKTLNDQYKEESHCAVVPLAAGLNSTWSPNASEHIMTFWLVVKASACFKQSAS